MNKARRLTGLAIFAALAVAAVPSTASAWLSTSQKTSIAKVSLVRDVTDKSSKGLFSGNLQIKSNNLRCECPKVATAHATIFFLLQTSS
jgi:hypothetical protein